jgi:hypothetical protein
LIAGCSSKPEVKQLESIQLEPITLSKAYPGNILEVNKIELMDGSTGERKTIMQEDQINNFISQIKDIELVPDENQEQRVGNIYNIRLLKGEEKKLGFVSDEINGINYKANLKFQGYIKAFFEEYFGREF